MNVASIRTGRTIWTGAVISTGSRGRTRTRAASAAAMRMPCANSGPGQNWSVQRVAVAHLQGEADAGGHHVAGSTKGDEDVARARA